MQVRKKLLSIFSFLLLSFSIVLAENSCANLDGNFTFNEGNTSATFSNSDLDFEQSDYYYFNVEIAGTIIIEFTSNPADKILMDYSETSCVSGIGGVGDTLTITKNSAFDFNLGLYATSDSQYEFDITFIPAPLSITKTVYPVQVEENNATEARYTIVITNNKETTLEDVHFTDNLPFEDSEIIDISSDNDDWDCTDGLTGLLLDISLLGTTADLDCTLDELGAGDSTTFTIDVNVTTDSDITNTAYVQADTTEIFSSSATIRAVTGSAAVELEIQKFASGDTIPPGTEFTYAIFVTNHVSRDADLITVTDIFPSDQNVSFIGYDSSTGWTCDVPADINDNDDNSTTFVCSYDSSLNREIAYFTITAKTDDGNYTGSATNFASVDALNEDIDGGYPLEDDVTITIGEPDENASFYGVYTQGGDIEVSEPSFLPIVGVNRTNARLQTKVASSQSITIPAYFINSSGLTSLYSFGNLTSNKTIPITVIMKLANDDCTLASNPNLSYDGISPVVAIIEAGQWTANAGNDPQGSDFDFDLLNIAKPKGRIIMQYVDINAELNTSGEQCSVSSLSANIKGLPQCLTNAAGANKFDNNKYINVFGIEAFVRCAIQNGQPCDSSNGGVGDPPYDNEYGCYECTVGGVGYCSQDNFAIRPRAFDVNISDGDIYNAGQDYNFAFKGLTTITDETTLDYNETQNDSFYVDLNVSDNSECQVKELDISPHIQYQDGLDDNNFRFNDIGIINMSIHEEANGSEFAVVDENDTLSLDDRLIEAYDVTFTVIPDHFDISATLTDHNNDHNFTYLHDINYYDNDDNYSMSSTLIVDIKAMGADNNITRNYTESCYAKETNLTLDIVDTEITYPGSTPAITQFQYYNPLDDNDSADSGEGSYAFPTLTSPITITELPIENIESTFPKNPVGADGNGTTHIEYKLNFDRKEYLVVNPINLDLSDVNITDSDAVEGTTGGTLTNQSATYHYARTRASKFFYEDIDTQSVNTPIMVDVYCDLSFTVCDNLNIDTVNGQINEINWWLSLGHNTSNDDGNITLMEGSIIEGNTTNWSVTPNVNITANATDPNIIVDRGTNYTLPLTVGIDLDESNPRDTDHWLIYNERYPMPLSPFYKVRFIGVSGWAGHGDTGHVVDSNTSIKKHRRLGW